MKQLATQNSQVYQYVEDLYEKSSHQREALLPTILESALANAIPHFERVFLVFDALDHCDEVTVRRPLLIRLMRLQQAGALVMVTSQPHPADIQYSLSEMVKFEVQVNEEDVRAYIDDYLLANPLARRLCGGERKEEIVKKLFACANGMSVMIRTCETQVLMTRRFLPIPFQLEYLSQQMSIGGVLKELDRLEENISRDRLLDHIYDRNLANMQRQLANRKAMAMKILNWLMFAKTTMTAQQISIALAVEPGVYETDELFLLEREILVDVCNGFVTVDRSNSGVRFAHPTVQEYLSRKLPEAWSGIDCAATCARYLSYAIFSSGACLTQADFLTRRISLTFFDYAARFLSLHVQDCAEESPELVAAILHLLSLPQNMQAYLQVVHCPNAFEVGVAGYDWFPRGSSPLHVAATAGYEPAVKAYLQATGNRFVSRENSLGQTPLHVAAKAGHASSCQTLLDYGASAYHTDRYGYMPLAWAVWGGHHEVVSVFSKQPNIGTILDRRTNSGETLLHLAAQRGHVNIALMLLRLGADAHVENAHHQTPLDIAKAENNIPLSNVFISATSRSGRGDTSSSLASSTSPTLPFVDAVEEMTASFRIETESGQPPSFISTPGYGSESIVQLTDSV